MLNYILKHFPRSLKASLLSGAMLFGFSGCSDGANHKKITDVFSTDSTAIADIVPRTDESKDFYDTCLLQTWLPDRDKDGFPDKSGNIFSCAKPEDGNYILIEDNVGGIVWDCLDDPSLDQFAFYINPAAAEICDEKDNNCNGVTDENLEEKVVCDGSQREGLCSLIKERFCLSGEYTSWGPCRELLKTEEYCDDIDNDCDGLTDEDFHLGEKCSVGSGNCFAEGVLACADQNSTYCDVSEIPISEEICDGIDNDCDGLVDNGLVRPCETVCGPGEEVCKNGRWTVCNGPLPQEEICNGIDDDCDGTADIIYKPEECQQYDIIFLIDNSGSMDQSDPLDLRYSGISKLIEESWDSNDLGTVVPFADDSQIMGPFTSDKVVLNGYLTDAKTAPVGDQTLIGKGLDAAIEEFKDNGHGRTVFLFSDGVDSSAIDLPTSYLNGQLQLNKVDLCVVLFSDVVGGYLSEILKNDTGGVIPVSSTGSLEMALSYLVQSYLGLKCGDVNVCDQEGNLVPLSGKCGVLLK